MANSIKIFKGRRKVLLSFLEVNPKKKGRADVFFDVKNQQYRYAMLIDKFNCLKKPMINLEVKMRQER